MIQAFVVFVAEFQRASCSSCMHCINTRIAGLIAFPVWWAQSAWIVNGVSLNGSSTSVPRLSSSSTAKRGRKLTPRFPATHCLILNTPQLNGVLQSNFALAQGAFKICRNTHWVR